MATMSDEFRFIAECCHFSFRGRNGPTFRETRRKLDWEIVTRLARFHRVQGLVARALRSGVSSGEAAVWADIRTDAELIAARNLAEAAESERLRARFAKARVPLLFLKGLTLGALVYGDASIKAALDIDILIDRSDLRTAAELLREEGYRLVVPRKAASSSALARWHSSSKESVWVKHGSGVQLDLHTRAADNPRLIPSIDVHSAAQGVEVANGINLLTLADEELCAYLTVHGASSAWFRLKWLADFAGLVCGRSADELDRLYRRSQQLGAGRASGQALLLADTIFGSLTDAPGLRASLLNDGPTRWLHDAALRLLTSDAGEPTERRLGTLTIHWTQFLLLPGAFMLTELRRQAGSLALRFS